MRVESLLGLSVGMLLRSEDGSSEGLTDGSELDFIVGILLGDVLGTEDGIKLGTDDGD